MSSRDRELREPHVDGCTPRPERSTGGLGSRRIPAATLLDHKSEI